MDKKTKSVLQKQHYSLVGRHSGIQICRWTKKSLLDEGFCYKQQFYGIKSHECCQMTPCFLCQNQCLHCWRAIEFNRGNKLTDADSPEKIIEGCIKAQRKMLSGFKGNKKINMKKFKEAQNPKQFAISLSGEPTIYPHLPELIKELRKRRITSFLVTNGLLPQMIEKLKKKNALPTQLYVSLNYSNQKLFRKITRNNSSSAWRDLMKTLSMLPNLKTRTVIRINLVRDLNMDEKLLKEYARLIKKAKPMFIELKGFMSVGFARQRLGYDRMPSHEEIKNFSKLLEQELKKEKQTYKILDEKIESRVSILGKNKRLLKIKSSEV